MNYVRTCASATTASALIVFGGGPALLIISAGQKGTSLLRESYTKEEIDAKLFPGLPRRIILYIATQCFILIRGAGETMLESLMKVQIKDF
jgi:hypothetical protein